jgi:chromosome segregation ATPase
MTANERDQLAELQSKLEASQRLVQQRDNEVRTYLEQISQLRHEIEAVVNPVPEVRQFRQDQLEFLEQQNNDLLVDVHELQVRYLQINAKKHSLQAQLASLRQPCSSLSRESEKSLTTKVVELEAQNATLTATLKQSEERLESMQRKLTEYDTENNKLRKEARETFTVLQQELTAARSGKFDQELARRLKESEAEQESLHTTIDQLENSAKDFAAQYIEFIQTMGQLLGCDDIYGIVERVKELTLLPSQVEKLRLEMVEMKNRRNEHVHEGYETIVDALQEVYDNLSPDALKLSENSVLQQLFASFCNLVTTLLKPVGISDNSHQVKSDHPDWTVSSRYCQGLGC